MPRRGKKEERLSRPLLFLFQPVGFGMVGVGICGCGISGWGEGGSGRTWGSGTSGRCRGGSPGAVGDGVGGLGCSMVMNPTLMDLESSRCGITTPEAKAIAQTPLASGRTSGRRIVGTH